MMKLASIRPLNPRAGRAPASDRVCPNSECKGSGNRITEEDGRRVCLDCGAVVSDANIVSEVQFGEAASGAAVVQGSYVGPDQTHARSFGRALKRAGGMESREITDNNGKRYINILASTLNIDSQTAEVAFRYYKLAVAQNFIQGRRTRDVAACCLYVACRKQTHSPWMLIDFSDVLQTNVFVLGHTYLKLIKDVPVEHVPPIVPENLIYRFASRLEFGEKTNKVANDAVRLVQRMSRDWMVAGRRPSGICGACLILAARMNNFRRTVREVVYIAKVTDTTITKRLEEFRVTESSNLTVDQFRSIWLENAHDPPAFYEPRSKRRKFRSAEANEETADELEDGPSEPRRDKDGFVIPEIPIDPSLLAATSSALSELEHEAESSSVGARRTRATTRGGGIAPISPPPTQKTDASSSQPTEPVKRPRGRPKKKAPEPPSAAELALEDEIEGDIQTALDDPDLQQVYHAAADEDAASVVSFAVARPTVAETPNIEENEFEDDPEVANCLLTEEESAAKETIWTHVNRDYLREQQQKRLRAETAERTGTNRQVKRRKRKPRIGEGLDDTPASSPAEAAKNMFLRRGFSKKINYAAIDSLFERDGDRSSIAGDSIAESNSGSNVGGDPSVIESVEVPQDAS